MTTLTRKASAPEYIHASWLLPNGALDSIDRLRRRGETGNDVVHRALAGRTVDELRSPGESTNDVIARVLREAPE